RWPDRSAGFSHEPGGRGAVDSLARLSDPGRAAAREPVLLCLPLCVAATVAWPMAASRPPLAGHPAQQVARGGPGAGLSVVVRSVCPLGQPLAFGLDRGRVLRG